MLLTMVAVSAISQTKGERPTLVVGIMIDQLRSDYLDLLQSRFGQHGFNRLMQNGVYFDNVDYVIPDIDAVSATAVIYTGTYPSINGIPAAGYYNTQKKISEKILSDPSQIGNFTDETFSPGALSVSTISDELRIDNNGIGYVYSISPDPQQAIIQAGHAGNSAFWINDVTGKWATTTFYKDVPAIMPVKNYQQPLSSRLDTMSWSPSLAVDSYFDIPAHRKYYPFRYFFPAGDKDRYRNFKNSALVNQEVTTVAIDYLKSIGLGKRGPMDMLNIAYTLAPYNYNKDNDFRIELQDSYIKLDQQLSRLFEAIDKNVGLKNTLVFVASTGYFNDTRTPDPKFNIPTGEFYPKRAISLLNMYLMAVYGNGEWVAGYDRKQFFLNRNLIKEKNIDLKEIRKKSGDFLKQVSGISESYTLDEILNNPVSEQALRFGKATSLAYAGDVRVEIAPGWEIIESDVKSDTHTHVKTNLVNTPVFILAPDIKPQKITSSIEAVFLAPTVSRILRIRSPNAAKFSPVAL